jgi:D-aminoacyl-tRNA deacylase
MKKIAIAYSQKDEAGKTIFNELRILGIPLWAKVYSFEEDSVHLPLDLIEEQNVIVLSKHASVAGTKSLTVHSLGNYSKADYGGEEKFLCPSSPTIQTNLLRGLNEKNTNAEYTVCYEVTHHGPATQKSVCFIELGSSINEWNNKDEAKTIAQTIVQDTLHENFDKKVIGIGGGHYAPDFTKLALRKNYSFGHICPQYALEALDAELLMQMISKTKAEEIVIDWKGLKGNKEKVVELCEKSGLPFYRVQKILK